MPGARLFCCLGLLGMARVGWQGWGGGARGAGQETGSYGTAFGHSAGFTGPCLRSVLPELSRGRIQSLTSWDTGLRKETGLWLQTAGQMSLNQSCGW